MQLILRMREKGGVTIDFTYARSRVQQSRSNRWLYGDEAMQLHGCTHDALIFLLLLCNLPSVRAIPESGVADHAADVRVIQIRVRRA